MSCVSSQSKGDVVSEKSKEPPPSEKAIISCVLLLVALVIIFYGLHFAGKSVVPDVEKWGQFGDYFGGVLNPAVATAALLLLARSVSIQRTELADAKTALNKQAQSAADTAELAALSSLVNAALAETQMHRDYGQFLVQQISTQDQLAMQRNPGAAMAGMLDLNDGKYLVHTLEGKKVGRSGALRQLDLVNTAIVKRMTASQGHEADIQALLDARRKKAAAAE
ncbi:hypothetical protein ACFJGX_11120 [Hydrogenophaga sp. UC242_50]|uniref:hypothetical protein n=1 Tax=unclassified Hydrogenophaga TaxID=2610897 RepID=UPI0036D34A61